jgi:hypothetical protein
MGWFLDATKQHGIPNAGYAASPLCGI